MSQTNEERLVVFVARRGSMVLGLLLAVTTASATAQSSDTEYFQELARQAEQRTLVDVRYDGRYVAIDYPMGDVPADTGVCTDVVIRAYRELGVDLQEAVHVDMSENFDAYPTLWGLERPDPNIDHRRVPNLMVYFERVGASKPITGDPGDYAPGDLVTWDLGGGVTHIGIVSTKLATASGHPLIAHNIGAGPELDDILFQYRIIGHYRYRQ